MAHDCIHVLVCFDFSGLVQEVDLKTCNNNIGHDSGDLLDDIPDSCCFSAKLASGSCFISCNVIKQFEKCLCCLTT